MSFSRNGLVVRNLCNDGLIGTGPFPGHTGLYGDYRRAIWHSTHPSFQECWSTRYLYPELTYDWANWVFSCFQCNVVNKQDKWPLGGYVDPCAADIKERPERFFGYDAKTGEVVPKPGLTKSEYDKAYRTITDLGLNSINVRWDRAKQIDRTQSVLMEWPLAEWDDLIEQLCDPSLEFSGITRAFLQHWLVPKECGEP